MLSSKQIRCHILDRKDSLEEALYWQKAETARIPHMKEAVRVAQTNLEAHLVCIEQRQKHIDYLESTMNTDWIDNPPY